MTVLKRCIGVLLITLLLLGAIPGSAAGSAQWTTGNTDLNISNGGVLLEVSDTLYYSEDGIYADDGSGAARQLTQEQGRNLNYAGGYIYYTLEDGTVRRIPADGGTPETVFAHTDEILRLYVIQASEFLFLSQGTVYSCSLEGEGLHILPAPENVCGLIPTPYGNLYLTGSALDYSLWAEETLLLEHVTSCYTDSGYLAISQNGENWQAEQSRLFAGFDPETDLEPFHIHENDLTVSLFGLEETDGVCEECEARAAELALYGYMSASGDEAEDLLTQEEDALEQLTPPEVSEGQRNIVLRARQLHEIQWTPLADRYQWGAQGTFQAETTYTGLPYGQPVNTGYVPWTVSLDAFLAAVNDNTSKFYTTYSTYNKTAPAYSCDCSAFVSYAWGLSKRYTTYSIQSVAEKVSDQSIYSLQIGDAMNKATSHVVLVSDVEYNDAGELVSVEIMEQTPVITERTRYGQGGEKSLADLQSYYLGRGYVILRNPNRDSVVYTHSCAVPIDGDYCTNCAETAPKSRTSAQVGSKTVELYHDDPTAAIYYTTNGTTPNTASSRYTGALTFTDTTQLRAIAVTGSFSSSQELKYTVSIPEAAAPTITVTDGIAENGKISYGSKLTLTTSTVGGVIYYTTDGSQPTTASQRYTSPISVQGDINIRAMVQAVGYKQSETAAFSYEAVNAYTIQASASAGGSISPSGSTTVLAGSNVTFQISAEPGYKLQDILVDGASVGAVSSYTFENLSDNHSISVSFLSIDTLPFQDVGEGNWFYNAVSFAYKNGLFSGVSETSFAPNDPMTRGMFVTVLGRYAGVPDDAAQVGVVTASEVRLRQEATTQSTILAVCDKFDIVDVLGYENDWYRVLYDGTEGWIRGDLMAAYDNRFTDVAGNKYYSDYIAWASLSGISNGVSASSYAPAQNITREQMCVLLYNYVQAYGLRLNSSESSELFYDDASISGYAKDAVYALKNAGVISGVGDGSFDPKGTATRAQVAQIIMNFTQALG